MRKKHAQIAQQLAVYRDLSDADRREVDAHVRDCAACAGRLAAYRAIDRDLARLAEPRPNARLREGFYRAIGVHDQQRGGYAGVGQQPMSWLRLAGQVVELAVVILLIAGLGLTLRGRIQSPVDPPAMPTSSLSTTAASPTETSPIGMTNLRDTIDAGIAGSGHAIDRAALDKSPIDSPVAPADHIPPTLSPGFFAPVTTLPQNDDGGGRVYFIQVDDTLWKLAEKYLGDGHRFDEIIEATHAKRAEDASFALIEDPNRIVPGSKLWIPLAGISPAELPTSSAEASKSPSPVVSAPTGHIAFSFWNDHPARCTYEIDVIDVAACLTGPAACQASRRIFSLNNASEPALSPGGDRLAFRGWGEPPSEDSPYLNCAPPVKARFLANTTLDGTELRGTGGFWEDAHPDWSPDGQQILFDSGRNGDGITRILLINADGSNERDLRIAGQQPSWAPDGQRFVYRGCDLTGNRCGLWLAYAAPVKSWEAGNNVIGPVVQDERAAHPDWSPDSAQIVYQSSKSGSWDLYVVSIDSLSLAGTQQLTNDPGIEGLPAWSPDGQWIAYLSDAGGNWGIWIIRADGGERHLLFPFDGGIFTPRAVEPYGQRDWIDEQISWSK